MYAELRYFEPYIVTYENFVENLSFKAAEKGNSIQFRVFSRSEFPAFCEVFVFPNSTIEMIQFRGYLSTKEVIDFHHIF